MTIRKTRQELTYQIDKTLKKLNEPSAYIRLIITRGQGEIGLDPTYGLENNIVIICYKLAENPSWWYEQGVHMIITDIQRTHKEAIDPNVKSGNYLNNVMAYAQARKQGAYDAIMLNRDGYVTEGTTSNIWIVSKGVLKTPPLKAGILEGITRKTVFDLAKKKNIEVREENFKQDELLNSEECFITSSTRQLVPVTKINKKAIGEAKPGKVTQQLLKLYRQHIKDYVEKRKAY